MRRFTDALLQYAMAIVYGHRRLTFSLLMLMTAVQLLLALQLRPHAAFEKQIPLQHPYMQVFKQYEGSFGGANLISIALMRRSGGDLYDPRFLNHLRDLTDEVFFLPGVDRSRVTSLFTPGVRYLEVVEDGFATGDVVPRNYRPTPEMLAALRANVAKAELIGRLVSDDERGALVVAELLERDPVSQAPLDYATVAQALEQLRGRYTQPVRYEWRATRPIAGYQPGERVATQYLPPQGPHWWGSVLTDRRAGDAEPTRVPRWALALHAMPNPHYDPQVSVHIIGFAKIVGDVMEASTEVLSFFAIAVLITLMLLWAFCGSLRLALLPLGAALTAVIWELGLLKLLGYGLDPFAILVPFLILAIGVSHGVQYINAWGHEVAVAQRSPLQASMESFRRLFLPGTVAILTTVIGFATLAFIQIEIVREMALNAALGMAAVIVTNKILLPIVLTWVRHRRRFYIDEDSWIIHAQDIYDERGQFWRSAESHSICFPNVPVVVNGVQVHYDLQSRRYVVINLTNEQKKMIEYDWEAQPSYFSPATLKRFATTTQR